MTIRAIGLWGDLQRGSWAAGSVIVMLLTGSNARAQTVSAAGTDTLTEIVVTAQRRVERAQDVPVSLQVISGAELDKTGASGFEDYVGEISSLGFTKSGNGAVQVGIRGVSNVDGTDYGIGTSKSTVGLYLNDIPIQGAGPLPDLALYDLQRIEVLKGPQGTLYGEGAMGGAIKMIVNSADPAAFAVKADSSVSETEHGGTNHDVRGTVNLPVMQDRAALRITATYSDDSGFIDNIVTGQHEAGSQTTGSVRALFDASLTDRFTSEVVLLHQYLSMSGFPNETEGLGDLQTNIPDHEYNDQTFNLFALALRYHFDAADFMSSTSYAKNDRSFYLRNPYIGLYDGGALLDFGLSGVPTTDPQGFSPTINQKAITEEVRLSSQGASRLSWTLGAYFRNGDQSAVSFDTLPNFAAYNAEMQAAAANPASAFNATLAAVGGTLSEALFKSAGDVYQNVVGQNSKQYAVFGESDFKLTQELSLKVGLRWFTEKNDITQFNQALAIEALDFALYGIPARSYSAASINDHGFVPRFGLSYSITKDVMAYALASKGFRSGGPNFNDGHSSVPTLYQPDTLWNYELGLKSSWLDQQLIANMAIYYIDWKNVQVPAIDPTFGTTYIANAGTARVTGGELQLEARPSTNWRGGLNLGLLNSKLTSLGPTVTGAIAGQELPNSPKQTASAFLQYSRPAFDIGTAVARFDYMVTVPLASLLRTYTLFVTGFTPTWVGMDPTGMVVVKPLAPSIAVTVPLLTMLVT